MPRIYSDEPLWRTAARNISRTSNQAIAKTGGSLGDIADLLLNSYKEHIDPEDKLNKAWGNRLQSQGYSPEEIQKYSQTKFPIPNTSDIESLQKKILGGVLPEDFITTPRGCGERVLDFATSTIPTLGKNTLSSVPKTLKSLLGSGLSGTAMEAAQDMGGGVLSQLGAGAGTNLIYDLLTSHKLRPSSIKQFGKEEQNRLSDITKAALPSGKSENAIKLQKFVTEMFDDVNTRSVKEGKVIKPELRKLGNELNTGKLSIEDAWKKKTSFNDMAYNGNLDKFDRDRYKLLAESMDKFILEEGKKYPGFVEGYEQVKDITKGIRHKSNLQKALENAYSLPALANSPVKSFIAPILTAVTSLATGSLKLGGGALAGGLALYKGTQYYDMLKNSKILQGYVKNLLASEVSGSAKNSQRLVLKINDYLKEHPTNTQADGYLD